ncbi:MAG: sigma-70 family RNA polymerase sigma factor [Mucilaginibacter sp.]
MRRNENIISSDLQPQDMDAKREAYNILIKKYSKRLFDFGYRFCQDDELVKDCIQQLYLDLWNRGFNISQTDTIKSYLFKSIRNRVLREKSKWANNELLDDKYDFILDVGIEEKLIADSRDVELAEKIQKVINTLPPRQREILYLRFYEDLSMQQISTIMNINKQSVYNLLQKAYQNFRLDWVTLVFLLSYFPKRIN